MQSVRFVSIRECREVLYHHRPRSDVDSVCVCVDRPNVKWLDAEVVVEVWADLSAAKWLGPEGEVGRQWDG